MKVAKREKGRSPAHLMADPMNEHDRRCKVIIVIPARDCVHHPCRVGNDIESKIVGHLFCGQIPPGHVNHSLPVGLDKPIGRLVFSRGDNNLGVAVN
jgi:hypothetical protein